MNLSERIEAFSRLGGIVRSLGLNERKALAEKARNENGWFTEESVMLSLKGVEVLLDPGPLQSWAMSYSSEPTTIRTIGVAMAGNIPMVGFHDFLCVLISGHKLKAKLSSQDTVLLKFILQKLVEQEPRFSERVSFEDTLKGVDAMIATGSDNTARYFEYYFRNIPHIIRKNRASCGVVQGDETAEEFVLLGKDVFSYFGLGCRSVSKLYVPVEFDLGLLLKTWEPFHALIDHHKFANNYTYQRSILLLDQVSFLDGGFILLRPHKNLVSPIATLFYERYESLNDLSTKIEDDKEKLQVVASAKGWFSGSIPFGNVQLPAVTDYADKVDTMRFLLNLK